AKSVKVASLAADPKRIFNIDEAVKKTISIFPQLNAQNQYFVQPVKNIGVYQDTSIKQVKYTSNDVVKKQNASTTISSDKNKVEGKPQKLKEVRDSLEYKTYHSKEIQYFVGIAAAMNVNDLDLETHTAELWNSFYENDISQVISNIVDERVYFIYSNTGKDGNFKATIAYRTKDIVDVYKGLEGIQIPPTRFAVFEQKGNDSESFIAETWTNIYESDLETSNGFNLEIYELDKDYKVKKSEIRIAIN
ncbi:MAG: GyrI-like domain-containing protein, partial [Chitinophagales bacterium]